MKLDSYSIIQKPFDVLLIRCDRKADLLESSVIATEHWPHGSSSGSAVFGSCRRATDYMPATCVVQGCPIFAQQRSGRDFSASGTGVMALVATSSPMTTSSRSRLALVSSVGGGLCRQRESRKQADKNAGGGEPKGDPNTRCGGSPVGFPSEPASMAVGYGD
jgi:hypothetical protein